MQEIMTTDGSTNMFQVNASLLIVVFVWSQEATL